MKILLGFIFFSSLYSCGQNSRSEQKIVNVYIAGCDSIFYCEDENFNSKTLHGSKSNDSVFIHNLLKNIYSKNKKVLFKPFSGTCGAGGLGDRITDIIALLKRYNIEYQVSNTDSTENIFFNDISARDLFLQQHLPPPPPPPLSSSSDTLDGRPFFQFTLKADGKVYYSYDSTDMNRNLIIIDNPTKEKLVQVLNDVEKQNKIKLSEGQIIIRGEPDATYAQFKTIKDALKEKDFFRFRFVTINNGKPIPPKAAEKETPIIVTKKTLTLLISASDEVFYYHSKDYNQIRKINPKLLNAFLSIEKRNTDLKDLMVIIKQQEGGNFKLVVEILDKVNEEIPAKHFAEIGITKQEINCIKNYKK